MCLFLWTTLFLWLSVNSEKAVGPLLSKSVPLKTANQYLIFLRKQPKFSYSVHQTRYMALSLWMPNNLDFLQSVEIVIACENSVMLAAEASLWARGTLRGAFLCHPTSACLRGWASALMHDVCYGKTSMGKASLILCSTGNWRNLNGVWNLTFLPSYSERYFD